MVQRKILVELVEINLGVKTMAVKYWNGFITTVTQRRKYLLSGSAHGLAYAQHKPKTPAVPQDQFYAQFAQKYTRNPLDFCPNVVVNMGKLLLPVTGRGAMVPRRLICLVGLAHASNRSSVHRTQVIPVVEWCVVVGVMLVNHLHASASGVKYLEAMMNGFYLWMRHGEIATP